MPVSRLDFIFDFISPNAYVAWVKIHALAEKHGREVRPVPVLFAGLLSANGAMGPAETRNKWRWMIRDLVRKTAALNLPLKPPASHPFNPLLALRLASVDMPDVDRRRLIDVLFDTVWAGGPGVTDPEVVCGILNKHGFDGPSLIEAATNDSVKQRLRDQTDAAAQQRVFGVPTVLVDQRLFWGYDDFPYLDAYLSGGDALGAADIAAWEQVQPSSVRKQDVRARNRGGRNAEDKQAD